MAGDDDLEDGQATLDEYAEDAAEELDAIREDVDRLTALVAGVAENQQDLATTVETLVGDGDGDPVDADDTGPDLPGFQ